MEFIKKNWFWCLVGIGVVVALVIVFSSSEAKDDQLAKARAAKARKRSEAMDIEDATVIEDHGETKGTE